MIIEQLVKIVISNQGKYYLDLGYKNVKQGDVMYVPWYQLPKNSNKNIYVKCDRCNITFDRQLQLIMKQTDHLCYHCSKKEIGRKNKNNGRLRFTI